MALTQYQKTYLRTALTSKVAADEIIKILEGSGDSGLAALGAPAGTNVTAIEQGVGPLHQTVLTLVATPVTLTDEGGVVLHGGQKIYDFPEGSIKIIGCVADLTVLVAGNLNADADGDVGVGTITASNNNTLSSTEQNICPTTAVPQLSSSIGTADCKNAADIAPLDGTSTAIDAFLNFIWDDADHNGGSMTVSGTITLTWMNLGDQ